MKWIVKLVAKPTPGQPMEQEIATLEREDLISPASVGLRIAEGKQILENLPNANRGRTGPASQSQPEVLLSHEGLLSIQATLGPWERAAARMPDSGLRLHGNTASELLQGSDQKESDHARVERPDRAAHGLVALWQGDGLFVRTPAPISENDGQYRAQPHHESGESAGPSQRTSSPPCPVTSLAPQRWA
ncbi:MAG: hypothetical protein JO185_15390 [Acidobacteriaceae bacterium]|nr:hypothetical protein [Acidobacteriaceae bacterium]